MRASCPVRGSIGCSVSLFPTSTIPATRRSRPTHGEWWPYIEAIHSNVPEFCFDRTTPPTLRDTIVLSEGDLVRFEVVGVHPQGPQDRLRYQLTGGYPMSEASPGSGWVEHSEFRVSVPKKRKVDFFLYVADVRRS